MYMHAVRFATFLAIAASFVEAASKVPRAQISPQAAEEIRQVEVQIESIESETYARASVIAGLKPTHTQLSRRCCTPMRARAISSAEASGTRAPPGFGSTTRS